jgi:hypothetical protein
MVIIRQNRTRTIFTLVSLFSLIAFGGSSIWSIVQSGKSYSLGVFITLIVLAAASVILLFRSIRAAVILDSNLLLIRGFLHSVHSPLDGFVESEMYLNCLRNAWLIGFKARDGKVVKFPFWSPSWNLNSEKNLPFKEFAIQIDQTIMQYRAGSRELSPLIETW